MSAASGAVATSSGGSGNNSPLGFGDSRRQQATANANISSNANASSVYRTELTITPSQPPNNPAQRLGAAIGMAANSAAPSHVHHSQSASAMPKYVDKEIMKNKR
jgi:hypothetical protein